MTQFKKSFRALMLTAAAALSLGGCARGGDDMWDRTGNHLEWHVLQYWKDAVTAHETFDYYFLDLDPMDPETYGRETSK